MSLTAVDPENERDLALLQNLLHKREYHLAELIDEVVFAEQERFKAVQEARSVRELATHLESAFDKLLQYHITMHKEVLLPTLVASVDMDGVHSRRSSMSRPKNAGDVDCDNGERRYANADNDPTDAPEPSNDFLNELLTEPQLSRETKQLLQAVMQQRRNRVAAPQQPRPPAAQTFPPSSLPSFSSEDANEMVQRATHRAIVLSDSLLRNQETLTRLLRSIQDQAEDILDRWTSGAERIDGGGGGSGSSTAHPVLTARRDPNMVQTPSPSNTTADSTRRTSGATSVAPFRLERLHQHSDRVREIEEALRTVEAERDALQRQLLDRETAPVATRQCKATPSSAEAEAWVKERVHLKQELAYAQQRALEEQARSRELKKQVAQLEQIAATSPIAAPPPAAAAAAVVSTSKSTSCPHCEKVRLELKRKAADYNNARAAWKAEEQRLSSEVDALQRRVAEAEAKAAAAEAAQKKAAAAAEKEHSQHGPLSSSAPPRGATTVEAPRYPAGPSSERKIGQLEATVAAMKADLQIMEMRMSIVQDERDAERRRIMAAHEQERERLRRERDECQKIIDKMSRELQGLSRANTGTPAIMSASS